MADEEVRTKVPRVFESIAKIAGEKNWEQIREDLQALSWLDANIPNIAPLITSVFKLLDTYAICDLNHEPRFKVLRLNSVKMFINTAFYNFAAYRNEIKEASSECKKRITNLEFFGKAKERLANEPAETLVDAFKEVAKHFEDMKVLAKSVTLHLKNSFQSDHSKEIEDFIDEQFFKQVLRDFKEALNDNSDSSEILLKYDRTYVTTYSTHYSNYPSQVWGSSYARENIYFGELNDMGQRHGYGEITYSNGDTYKGSWASDKPEGRGVYVWKESGRYEGDFVAAKMQGSGKRVYSSGNIYTGSFIEGKKHGHGIMKYHNGDEYNGEWDDDYMHGRGTYTWVQGDSFTGKFVKDRREGKGTLTLASGEVIEGEWANGKMRASQT